MTARLQLRFSYLGHEVNDVPVRVEIFDTSFHQVDSRWLRADENYKFQLEPGLYEVRASISSGIVCDQAVRVHEGRTKKCVIPLHAFSPHESHEWAYFTQNIDAPGTAVLSDPLYTGLWMRLWERKPNKTWIVRPLPGRDDIQVSPEEDGVSYTINRLESKFYALQFGGPNIPWKVVALPSTYRRVMVLVRPSVAPAGRAHPLEVVVSSTDWNVESLLSFMQSGDMNAANDLVEKSNLAELLLYSKMEDSNAAAVGGYFLLRSGSLERLHNWANNLAQWFSWQPDGAIIHAWQLIRQVNQDQIHEQTLLDQALQRLLEAVERGFPLYTEGLRLLRDGLVLFDQRARGENQKIRKALEVVGEYSAAADWSAANTSFIGATPDKPSDRSEGGTPKGDDPLVYVYDVPMLKAIESGVLQPGLELIADLSNRAWHCKVSEKGMLDLEDGRSFNSLGALQTALTGKADNAWNTWRVSSTNTLLIWAVQSLRESHNITR